MDRKPAKDETALQFGTHARAYAESPGHAHGPDLRLLIDMVRPRLTDTVLDVATGAGHTAVAIAPSVRSVTAIDLAPEMVEQANALAVSRTLGHIRAEVMDVEAMRFASSSFDLVTCRIAPHHFPDIDRALNEIARVLVAGGRFGLEDNLAPADAELDACINHVERLLDPTHVRSYTEGEWRRLLERAGFVIVELQHYRKTHSVAERIARSGCDAKRAAQVDEALRGAPQAAREHFELRADNTGRVVEFTDDKVLVCAVREA